MQNSTTKQSENATILDGILKRKKANYSHERDFSYICRKVNPAEIQLKS